jgi:hypothetical protein
VPEDENEVDLSLLLEKERSKIILQREREAQKAMDKVEAQKVKDKEARAAKKGGRASKSKTVVAPSPPLLLTETSTASTAPAGRSSHMKYLSMTLRENLVKQLLSTSSEIWNSKPFEV